MASLAFPRPIREGTEGRDVLAIKRCLKRLGYGPTMNAKDATWGKGSMAALSAFLKKNGYPHADGQYGPKAHAKLSPRMDAYERKLMAAVYNKLHAPKTAPSSNRTQIVKAARLVYDNRNNHRYTQGGMRWVGINNRIRPPHFPSHSDCSSFITWCYWLALGDGPDILNGQNWRAGYTGTMMNKGRAVISASQLRPGDCVFYGSPVGHVALYVGGGRVISHGHDPVGLYSVYYRPPTHFRSYLK